MQDFTEQWQDLMQFERSEIQERPEHWFYMVRYLYRWQYKQWFLGLLTYFGDEQMARGKGASNAPSKTEKASQWTTFVTIPVTVEDATDMEKEYGDAHRVYQDFTTLCVAGYRVGFSYDIRTDAIICSVTCKDDKSPNFGKTFTAFAGDWYTALKVAVYKHYVVANEVWGEAPGKAERPAFG